MIEFAYFLPSIEKLKLFTIRDFSLDNLKVGDIHDYFASNPSNESLAWNQDHLAYVDPSITFNRIYFGNEFCEALIPTVEDFELVSDMCRKSGLRLTLVTPMVTTEGINKIQKLLRHIQENKMIIELVANDYGVLSLCAGNSTIRPILGRGILGQTQFARLEGIPSNHKGIALKDWPQRHVASTAAFLNLITKKYGVGRVEFDLSRQGLLIPAQEKTLQTSVYFPWVVINTQRVCPIGHIHRPETEAIPAHPACEFQCRSLNEVLQSTSGDHHQLLFQKGTTLFELVKPEIDVFKQLAATVNLDRIVYQPTLPF